MRLYRGKIPGIADDIVRVLTSAGHIETVSDDEVRMDITAVLNEFVRRDRQVVDEAKRRMEIEGLSYSMLGRVKQRVAKELSLVCSLLTKKAMWTPTPVLTKILRSRTEATIWNGSLSGDSFWLSLLSSLQT